MLNLTDFNWVLEARSPDQLQLRIYTAPHMAAPLLRVLPATWKARIDSGRAVRIRRGSAILSFFRALGQHPHLVDALRAYVATYRGRGSRTHAARVAAVKQVMRFLIEGPDPTSPNVLADTAASLPGSPCKAPLPGAGEAGQPLPSVGAAPTMANAGTGYAKGE